MYFPLNPDTNSYYNYYGRARFGIDFLGCDTYFKSNSVMCGVKYQPSEVFGSSTALQLRLTAEEYVYTIINAFTSNSQYPAQNSYYYNTQPYISTVGVSSTVYEGQNNTVFRIEQRDIVGNLQQYWYWCFCMTDYCNIDFTTCATGINYNSTSTTPLQPIIYPQNSK
ncbi:unnamed protein product [Didymodactylos carnosus]|nr:unnamed protein product [Didymodactylos carnosus]CAF4146224.1 unnamed protein product [Didymodactylos carnosus]